jgi:hypothetical protein
VSGFRADGAFPMAEMPLTASQRKLVEFVSAYLKAHSRFPTVQETRAYFGPDPGAGEAINRQPADADAAPAEQDDP